MCIWDVWTEELTVTIALDKDEVQYTTLKIREDRKEVWTWKIESCKKKNSYSFDDLITRVFCLLTISQSIIIYYSAVYDFYQSDRQTDRHANQLKGERRCDVELEKKKVP